MVIKITSEYKGISEEQIKQVLDNVERRTLLEIQESAIIKAPVDTAFLRNSIQLLQDEQGWYILVSAPYAAAIEYGTMGYYPPIQPLKDWAKRKLGDENIAYAVQKKIAKEGITAQPFLRPALDEIRFLRIKKIAQEEINKLQIN